MVVSEKRYESCSHVVSDRNWNGKGETEDTHGTTQSETSA